MRFAKPSEMALRRQHATFYMLVCCKVLVCCKALVCGSRGRGTVGRVEAGQDADLGSLSSLALLRRTILYRPPILLHLHYYVLTGDMRTHVDTAHTSRIP